MMFQRSHFRTTTTTTTTCTSNLALLTEAAEATSDPSSTPINNNNNKGQQQVTVCGGSRVNRSQFCALTRSSSSSPKAQQAANRVKLKSSSSSSTSSSFRRLLLAVLTLRLTSTSTSTAVGTTSGGTLLAALLKSLLVGCYYLLAFTSLLMLIFYINQFASQSQATNRILQTASELQANSQEKLLMKHELSVEPSTAAASSGMQHTGSEDEEAVNRSASQANRHLHLAERSKRSVQVLFVAESSNEHQMILAPVSAKANAELNSPSKTTGKRTIPLPPGEQLDLELIEQSAIEIQRRNHHHQQQQPTAPVAAAAAIAQNLKPSSQSKQLTFRSAASQRQNESQWIPIVPAQPTLSRQQQQVAESQRGQPSKRPQVHQQSGGGDQRAVTLTQAESALPKTSFRGPSASSHNLPPPRQTQQLSGGLSSQQVPQVAASGHHHQRQWRRPRFNLNTGYEPMPQAPPRVNKMYKRVLLCDKTLVSLDYIRNPLANEFELPHPLGHIHSNYHHHSAHFEGDFDDNFIELDTKLEQIFADRQNFATDEAPDNNNATGRQQLDTSASMTDEIMAAERRSYLTDDDPLVMCDMWDLEKGLKNRKPPKEILRMAVRADFDTVRDAINRCRQLSEKTLPPDDDYRDGLELMSAEDLLSLFSMKRGLMPGTKWCGLGDQASSYNDLGSKHRIDICCRAHDHCPIRLKPFRNDYGVLNIALYTKSHCDCDADFYRCLREAHSRMADMLGNLYFNVMKLQCMREERMKVCREMKPIALGFERCVRYEESPAKRVFKFTTPPVAY